MNRLQGLFADVKAKYNAYLTSKRKAKKWDGVALPSKAKEFVQAASHEVIVLQNHLAAFEAISIRSKSNTRFTKAQLKNMKTAIGMVEKYIAHYKRVIDAWMPYTKKRTLKNVSLPTFPVIDQSGEYTHVAFAKAVMLYFDTIRRAYEKGANQTFNRPVLPFKRNIVNLRTRTLAEAKEVKRPVKLVRNMLKKQHTQNKEIQQRKINRAQENVDQLSKEIQTQYELRLINRKKHEDLKLKARTIRSALADCLAVKQGQAQQIAEFIDYIKNVQQFVPPEYRIMNNSNNNMFYNVNNK